MSDRIVAIGLLTQRDVDVLGQGFRRAFPVDDLSDFDSLLHAITEADRRLNEAASPAQTGEPVGDA